MNNFNPINPRFRTPGDFRQPTGGSNIAPTRTPVSTGRPAAPVSPLAGFDHGGSVFTPSVPDDVGNEMDRFRQARNRFGVGQHRP